MTRLQLLFVAAVAATAVAVVAATSQAGSPEGRTIQLVERGGSFTFVDSAPARNKRTNLVSAGDFFAGSAELYDASGQQAGSLHVLCVATVGGKEIHAKFQCDGTVALADGTLSISALNERRADQDVDHISIVGGTGAYEGARGSMTSNARPSGNATDDVIHLLP